MLILVLLQVIVEGKNSEGSVVNDDVGDDSDVSDDVVGVDGDVGGDGEGDVGGETVGDDSVGRGNCSISGCDGDGSAHDEALVIED